MLKRDGKKREKTGRMRPIGYRYYSADPRLLQPENRSFEKKLFLHFRKESFIVTIV